MKRCKTIMAAALLAAPVVLAVASQARALSVVGEPVPVPHYTVQYVQGGRWHDYQSCYCDPAASAALMELRLDFGVRARAVYQGRVNVCPVYPYGSDPRVTTRWHLTDGSRVLQALPPSMRMLAPGASPPSPGSVGPQPMPQPPGIVFPNPGPFVEDEGNSRRVEELRDAARSAYRQYQQAMSDVYRLNPVEFEERLARSQRAYAAAVAAYEQASGRRFEP